MRMGLGSSSAVLALLFVALCPTAGAQSKAGAEKNPLDHPGCKSYFMIFWADSHIPGGILAHWEKSQEKWYLGAGVKKYPNVCLDARKATYLLVYTTEEHAFQVTEFKSVGGGSADIEDNDGNTVGTADIPSTEIPVERTVQRTTVYMYVFSTGDKPFLSGGKPGPTPLQMFVENEHSRLHTGLALDTWGGLSKPAKDAMQDAIRFVSSVAK